MDIVHDVKMTAILVSDHNKLVLSMYRKVVIEQGGRGSPKCALSYPNIHSF